MRLTVRPLLRPLVKSLPEPMQPWAVRRLEAIREGLVWSIPLSMYARAALDGEGSGFVLGGRRYRYLWHPYMSTWLTERAVEVPVVWSRVRKADPASTLEIGNVLSHYFPAAHTVVDKYEEAPGVINEDALEFDDGRRYDLIVSVSTLEHVGYDEQPKDAAKGLRAIEHLRELLTDSGELWFTIPKDWNPELDRHLADGRIRGAERRCLKLISEDGRWTEVDCDELEEVRYDTPFPYANGVTFAVVRN
jgi:hypothetical protein